MSIYADPKVLENRLRSVLALDGEFSKEAARDCIEREGIHGAVCARIPAVNGRIATFEQFYKVCFGETLAGKEWKPKVNK